MFAQLKIKTLKVSLLTGVVIFSLVASLGITEASASGTITYNPLVQTMINNVSQAELAPAVKDLSGVTTPIIGGSPYRILVRFSDSGVPIDKVEQYIYETLQTYGLSSVAYQTYPGKGKVQGGRNVIGQITGTTKPNEIVIFGCHMDNQPWGAAVAPGADDNASGCSALLFMARQFAGKSFARTIRFVFFGSEENAPWTGVGGTYGSGYYATQAKAANENIVAMVEMDGLAWNAGDNIISMQTRSKSSAPAAELALLTTWHDVIATYGITGVTIYDESNNLKLSDHGAFWYHYTTVPAVLLIEYEDVGNPNWHTVNDTIDTFNWPYYIKITQSAVGLAAHLAQIISTQ